jgi:transcriptional regulator with XRE-family HTH domain
MCTTWSPDVGAIAALRPRGRADLVETGPSPGFGTLLRRYRVAAGLSQEELAEWAGLSARTVGDLERGVSHAPRKDSVALLAQALALAASERATLTEGARRLSTAAGRP